MTIEKETKVEYITSSRSIHELNNTIAYYNYEGTHFRVFESFDDAKAFIAGEHANVIAECDSEKDLDRFLEDTEICSVCGTVCWPDSECYEDADTGDSCCTECCFFDEADDVYRKGTIEKYLHDLKLKKEEEDEANANLASENKAMGDYLQKQLGFSQDNIADIANGSTNLFCVHAVFHNELKSYKLYTKLEEAHVAYIALCKEWYNGDGLEEFAKTAEFESEVEHFDGYYDSPEYGDYSDNACVAWKVLSAQDNEAVAVAENESFIFINITTSLFQEALSQISEEKILLIKSELMLSTVEERENYYSQFFDDIEDHTTIILRTLTQIPLPEDFQMDDNMFNFLTDYIDKKIGYDYKKHEFIPVVFETTTYTLPSFWATAIFNSDESGMEDEDIESMNNWLKANPLLSLADGHWSLVEDEEPFFAKHHDAQGYVLACDCLTYIWNYKVS